MKLVVTGTGRCGTGYMARRLTAAGLPCGHEAVFNPTNVKGGERAIWDAAGRVEAESSWMAAPYLNRAKERNAVVLLVLRDPEAIVRSLLGIRFFETPSPYLEFIRRQEIDVDAGSPESAAWRFVEAWIGMALPLADYIVSVEHLHRDERLFARAFERLLDSRPEPHAPPPPSVNHRATYGGKIDCDRARRVRQWFEVLER